jgi:small-conductance mechanosensitive channel
MNTPSPFEQVQQFTNLWMEFATRMMTAASAFGPAADKAPPQIAKEIRGTMFAAMSEQAEKFMRSEQFLAMMKQSLDQSIGMRKQLNELLTKAHHSVQGVAQQDVGNLMLSVRHLESRLLEQTELLVGKLADIEQRLDAIEKSTRLERSNGQAHARHEQPASEPRE